MVPVPTGRPAAAAAPALLMGFWEEHYAAEAAVREKAPPAAQKAEAAHSQNGPTQCATCPHVGTDVLLGVCNGCFAAYKAAKW